MSWSRFKETSFHYPNLGLSLDLSRLPIPDDFLASMEPKFAEAFAAMAALEKGAIANPDENRMVGHYWLRAPQLAPTPEIAGAITSTETAIREFTAKVHRGEIAGPGGKFRELLVIGIGGSALGPQLVSHALGRLKTGRDRMRVHFFDNTDPDGMDYVLKDIGAQLRRTLVVVISKSGGTIETRNGMLEAAAAFKAAGLDTGGAFRRGHRRGLEAGRDRAGGGLARPFPHVGLGRRTHLRAERGGPPARRPCRASRSSRCWPGPRRWTS